jgi:hypothetical protein
VQSRDPARVHEALGLKMNCPRIINNKLLMKENKFTSMFQIMVKNFTTPLRGQIIFEAYVNELADFSGKD